MDLHCMYQNDLFAFGLCACRVNSESTMARAQLALKGNGRWDSDWFIARYAENTSITKRIATTLLDHAPGNTTIFPVVKLAKVDSDMP